MEHTKLRPCTSVVFRITNTAYLGCEHKSVGLGLVCWNSVCSVNYAIEYGTAGHLKGKKDGRILGAVAGANPVL